VHRVNPQKKIISISGSIFWKGFVYGKKKGLTE
jgi:hypothetical protein